LDVDYMGSYKRGTSRFERGMLLMLSMNCPAFRIALTFLFVASCDFCVFNIMMLFNLAFCRGQFIIHLMVFYYK
jgi:hypothetical protein